MNITTENTKILHKEHGAVHVNGLATKIIGLSIDVHNSLGSGLLESCYKECCIILYRQQDYL